MDSLRWLIKAMIVESITGDFGNMKFDAEEVADFVTEYIRRHKITAKPVSDVMFDYYLPIGSKQDLDDVGFSSYRMEPTTDGEGYVVVRWHKVG